MNSVNELVQMRLMMGFHGWIANPTARHATAQMAMTRIFSACDFPLCSNWPVHTPNRVVTVLVMKLMFVQKPGLTRPKKNLSITAPMLVVLDMNGPSVPGNETNSD